MPGARPRITQDRLRLTAELAERDGVVTALALVRAGAGRRGAIDMWLRRMVEHGHLALAVSKAGFTLRGRYVLAGVSP